ncbi:MAG: hypothetical protein II920_01115 [Clostridia bacterium]|nr:hypothetical protein [Clostridia bacterium]
MAGRVCPHCGAVVTVDVRNCPICRKSMSGSSYGVPAPARLYEKKKRRNTRS